MLPFLAGRCSWELCLGVWRRLRQFCPDHRAGRPGAISPWERPWPSHRGTPQTRDRRQSWERKIKRVVTCQLSPPALPVQHLEYQTNIVPHRALNNNKAHQSSVSQTCHHFYDLSWFTRGRQVWNILSSVSN